MSDVIEQVRSSVFRAYDDLTSKSVEEQDEPFKLLTLRAVYDFIDNHLVFLTTYYDTWYDKHPTGNPVGFVRFMKFGLQLEKSIHESIVHDIESAPPVEGLPKAVTAGKHIFIVNQCNEMLTFLSSKEHRDVFIEHLENIMNNQLNNESQAI